MIDQKKNLKKNTLTKLYVFNNKNKLVKEIHLNENKEEILRYDTVYSDNSISITIYKLGKFITKENSLYKNDKIIEAKLYTKENSKNASKSQKHEYLNNGKNKRKTYITKEDTYIKEWNYFSNGNLKSQKMYYLNDEKSTLLITLKYDNYGNETSVKVFRNGEMEKFDRNEYNYYN